MGKLLYALPVLLALSLVYLPAFWVNFAVLVDFYTPWVLFDSPLYEAYHQFITKDLPERPELPMLEIPASEASLESVKRLTKGWTVPVIIRGLLGNTTGVQKWGDHKWWVDNYGSEELLCGTFSSVMDECTIRSFFSAVEEGRPFYVTGASIIFDKHPELHKMIDNDAIRAIEPGKRTATQVFMGVPGSGSDIHSAMGVNVFRMVTGRKKWWFIPPDQTAYLKPSINVNGFSSHTQTLIGKPGSEPSPWLSKLVRYTAVVNPGDVLVNPPWFWHGILNLGNPGEIVIGSPVRYGKGDTVPAALKTNLMFSINGMITVLRNHGFKALTADVNLQHDIAGNRKDRAKDSE